LEGLRENHLFQRHGLPTTQDLGHCQSPCSPVSYSAGCPLSHASTNRRKQPPRPVRLGLQGRQQCLEVVDGDAEPPGEFLDRQRVPFLGGPPEGLGNLGLEFGQEIRLRHASVR